MNALAAGGRQRLPIVVRAGSPGYAGLLAVRFAVVAGVIVWGAGLGPFQTGQLTLALIYAVAIAGLNVAAGYAGLLSVGHSAFFGLGAYTTGILIAKQGWDPLITFPVSVAICFVIGLVVGLPTLRIRGLYLAIVTLALAVAFPQVIDRFPNLTNGSVGLTISLLDLRPPAWTGFTLRDRYLWLYWLTVCVLALVVLLVHNLAGSRFGLAMVATRDRELAAAASGVNLATVRVLSFGISGAFTGLAGSVFAIYLGSLSAEASFGLLFAVNLLIGLIVGGQATRLGPILGGLILVFLPYYTSDLGQGQLSGVLFGVLLLIIIFVMPEGLIGGLHRVTRRVLVVTPATPRPFEPDSAVRLGTVQPAGSSTAPES